MKILSWILCFSLPLAISTTATCQTETCKIYQVKNDDGTFAIVGENHGIVPYSVFLKATLFGMHSTVALPTRFALVPGTTPQVLTVLVPDYPNYSFRYSPIVDLGVYTGRRPDSSIVYVVPFQASTDTIRFRQKFKYQYAAALPPGTPIVAARAGTVALIHQDKKSARQRQQGNRIFIYHADGTYGSYENLLPNSVLVHVGQQVKPGELLAYSGRNKYEPNFWYAVVYLTATGVEAAPVNFQPGLPPVDPR